MCRVNLVTLRLPNWERGLRQSNSEPVEIHTYILSYQTLDTCRRVVDVLERCSAAFHWLLCYRSDFNFCVFRQTVRSVLSLWFIEKKAFQSDVVLLADVIPSQGWTA